MKFLLTILILLILPVTAMATENPSINTETAIFAGGCFWCMEGPFDKLSGVLSTTSGYTGGHVENPTYEQVTFENTGHYESVKITFDPAKISYEKLLETFWKNIDPIDSGGQFCDRGPSYQTAIFYQGDEQKKSALESRAVIEKKLKASIATKVLPSSTFYPAEDYHQDFYKKSPIRYKIYRYSCGRDKRLGELWD